MSARVPPEMLGKVPPEWLVQQRRVLADVEDEVHRQIDLWGVQSHPDGTGGELETVLARAARSVADQAALENRLTWRHILREEFFEAMAEIDPEKLAEELNQVAAVALSWRRDILTRKAQS